MSEISPSYAPKVTPSASVGTFQSPSIFPLSSDDNRILIFAGVRGCGKTERVIRVLKGLGKEAKNTGVIVTEIQGASPRVDLDRLPKEITDTVGIEGCACCAANKQVLDELKRLKTSGRNFFLIEQSGYSDAAELARTLKAQGYNPAVVAVVSPEQLNAFQSHQWRHARASSTVLVSHVDSNDPAIQEKLDKVQAFVTSATSDVTDKPEVLFDNGATEPLLKVWESASRLWQKPQSPVVQIGSSKPSKGSLGFGSANDAKAGRYEMSRTMDVQNFTEVLLFLSPALTPEELVKRLDSLSVEGDAKPVARAKGAIGGYDIDIIRTDSGLQLVKSARAEASTLFDGRNFLCISSTNRFFKELSLVQLASKIGMVDLTEDTINAIRANYPTREQIFEAMHTYKEVLLSYPEDRNLDELLNILPFARGIEDKQALEDLGFAVSELVYEHMRVRTNLLEIIQTDQVKQSNNASDYAITVGYAASRVLYQPQISRMINNDPEFLQLSSKPLSERRPATTLLEGIASSSRLAINDDVEVTPIEREVFRYIINSAIEQEDISKELLERAAKNIDSLIAKFPLDKRLATWAQISQALRENPNMHSAH
jgi:G3E family GTPase